MKKEQNLLTIIIVLATIALIVVVGSIVYEERLKNNKKSVENISKPIAENYNKDSEQKEETSEQQDNNEYIGEEEQTQNEEPTQSKDEKAVELAKKEWGEDDSVTFSVEEKNGTKYYVAVKREATTIAWYEVDTENWQISEY